MAVFPASAIRMDPGTGDPVCPQVVYGANNLPEANVSPCADPDALTCPHVPAVGGRAFYNPGDDETVVDLGCPDLSQLTDPQVCTGIQRIDVTASINDFDNLVSSVDKTLADDLDVSFGEPMPAGDTFSLNDDNSLVLTTATTPAWAGTFDGLEITSTACIAVRDPAPSTTTSVRCYPAGMKTTFDLEGAYVSRATLAKIVASVGKFTFPDEGMTIGIVVNENFAPLAGQKVSCLDCTVQYVNDTRDGVGGTVTSASGIFVSDDAPYGTQFSIPSPDSSASTGIGGLIEGKVTVVVLQYKDLQPN
jgi:hypothetical protein